jgi:uncharacterized protein YndB with AHSA1/START domain
MGQAGEQAAGRADVSDHSPDSLSVVVEREFTFPPEKIWRALTEPHLLAEWLAKTDFAAILGHRFSLRIDPQPDRSFVFDCEVIVVEPGRALSYSWNSTGDEPGKGLRSVVTWRLTATPTGTRLRLEQSGFAPDQPLFYIGARMGWPNYLAALEQVLTRLG